MADGQGGRALRAFAWLTAALLFILLLMGFVVTETGSGRGCGGSWPLCHGKFIPAFAFHTLIEFSHRSLAAIVGILVLILAIWAWRQAGRVPFVKVTAAVGLLFVIVQAGIGAADVMHPQSASILALHFGFSLIALAAIAILAFVLGEGERTSLTLGGPPDRRAMVKIISVIAFVYVYGVVYLGAYVSHSGTGTACATWPLCQGGLIPLSGPAVYDMLHRLAAAGSFFLLLWLFFAIRPVKDARPDLGFAAHVAIALVTLQIISGAVLVWSLDAVWAVMIHVALMSVLFTALAYIFLHAVLGMRRREEAR